MPTPTTAVPVKWEYSNACFKRAMRGPRKGKNTIEVTIRGMLPDDFKQGGYEKLMGFLVQAGYGAENKLNAHLPSVLKET